MRKNMKKMFAMVLAVAITVGLIPVWSAPAVAETVSKAYEMVVEPTMVYQSVYGFEYGVSKVQNEEGKWGVIDTKGTEVIPCEYLKITPIAEDKILAKNQDKEWFMLNSKGESVLLNDDGKPKSYGKFYDISYVKDNVLYCDYSREGNLTRDKYIDYEGNEIKWDGDFDYIYNTYVGSLYGGKYYLQLSYGTCVLLEASTGKKVRTYDDFYFYEMWVSADDTRLVGKKKNDTYVEIDCGSKKVTATYGGYTELWPSRYDNEVMFGIKNDEFVALKYSGEIICNYGRVTYNEYDDKNSYEVLPGYVRHGNKILKYDGTVVIENFEYDDIYGDSFVDDKYFMVEKNESYYDEEYEEYWDDYHYYLFDLEGKLIEELDQEEAKEYCEYLYGETISYNLYEKPYKLSDNYTLVSKKDGTKFIFSYNRMHAYGICTYGEMKHFKYNDLFMLYNEGISNEAGDWYIERYEDANIFYEGSLLFEENLEAVGNIDEINGYLPIKQDGKWGIIKLKEQTKKYTDDSLKDEIDNTTKPSDKPSAGDSTTKPAGKPSAPSTTKPATTTTKNETKISKPAKVSKVSAKKGKKKVSLTIKKVKKAKGYMIQYSTNKKFKKAKTKYTTSTKITIKKLKSKKTYYFRVKAYKLNGKKKVLSNKWSSVKTVKVK